MDKFSELIRKGVASFGPIKIGSDVPDNNPKVRSYNNIFSIATDTHASSSGDNIIITGSLISHPDKFDRFIWYGQWGGVYFAHTGYNSFGDWMNKNGFKGHYEMMNGDSVYVLTPKSPDGPVEQDHTILPGSYIVYNVEEDLIPKNVRFLTKTNDINDFNECYDKNIYIMAQNLNESRWVYGDSWFVVNMSDGDHLVCSINNKSILI